MKTLVRCGDSDGREACIRPPAQPFIYPDGVLADGAPVQFWTCVRTRPRWEKKFASWLMDRPWGFFLPLVVHTTRSGGKRRRTLIPLFAGYVFVAGRLGKGDFDRTGMVVYVLQPDGPAQVAQLHAELAGIWRGLASGLYAEKAQTLAVGEPCVIARGPLQGQRARFERRGRQGRLILQVELMGGGLAVEVPEEDIEACPD